MTRFTTFGLNEPPAAISYFTPGGTYGRFVATNWSSGVSATEQRIRSAFEGAGKELNRYGGFHARWDGYEGEPFEPTLIAHASWILRYSQNLFVTAGVLPHLVTTGPAPDGSIDVELQVAQRRVLMTMYPGEEQVRVTRYSGGEGREHVERLREETLDEWVAWLNDSNAVQARVENNRPRAER